MSFQKKDRIFQSEMGQSFRADEAYLARPFAEIIADAMQAEWGATPSARKEVCRITGANERAVRNWFEAKNGPSGENLIHLIRHSGCVLASVLHMAGRQELLNTANVLALREHLARLMESIDSSQHQGS